MAHVGAGKAKSQIAFGIVFFNRFHLDHPDLISRWYLGPCIDEMVKDNLYLPRSSIRLVCRTLREGRHTSLMAIAGVRAKYTREAESLADIVEKHVFPLVERDFGSRVDLIRFREFACAFFEQFIGGRVKHMVNVPGIVGHLPRLPATLLLRMPDKAELERWKFMYDLSR